MPIAAAAVKSESVLLSFVFFCLPINKFSMKHDKKIQTSPNTPSPSFATNFKYLSSISKWDSFGGNLFNARLVDDGVAKLIGDWLATAGGAETKAWVLSRDVFDLLTKGCLDARSANIAAVECSLVRTLGDTPTPARSGTSVIRCCRPWTRWTPGPLVGSGNTKRGWTTPRWVWEDGWTTGCWKTGCSGRFTNKEDFRQESLEDSPGIPYPEEIISNN